MQIIIGLLPEMAEGKEERAGTQVHLEGRHLETRPLPKIADPKIIRSFKK